MQHSIHAASRETMRYLAGRVFIETGLLCVFVAFASTVSTVDSVRRQVSASCNSDPVKTNILTAAHEGQGVPALQRFR